MRCFLAILLAATAFSHAQTAGLIADAAPRPLEIVTQEQQLWTTFAEGDFATVRSLFTPDYIQVTDTIQALDATLIFLKHCHLTSYELRDLQVRILTPNSALTAYHLLSTFTCSSGTTSDIKSFDNNALTIWIRRDHSSKWLAQAHSETPHAKP